MVASGTVSIGVLNGFDDNKTVTVNIQKQKDINYTVVATLAPVLNWSRVNITTTNFQMSSFQITVWMTENLNTGGNPARARYIVVRND